MTDQTAPQTQIPAQPAAPVAEPASGTPAATTASAEPAAAPAPIVDASAPSEPEDVPPGEEFQGENTPPIASRPTPAGPNSNHHRDNPYAA